MQSASYNTYFLIRLLNSKSLTIHMLVEHFKKRQQLRMTDKADRTNTGHLTRQCYPLNQLAALSQVSVSFNYSNHFYIICNIIDFNRWS